MKKYSVAIIGATGLVGQKMIEVLEERKFPVAGIVPLASSQSKGSRVRFCGNEVEVKALSKDSFKGVDIALFSAGADVSKEYAPLAVKSGATVIDNTSAFRMDKDVPLVVPEVNPGEIKRSKGIIANPNCSTIQLVCVLNPIHTAARIRRVVVATYQSVSGAGKEALAELEARAKGSRLAYNCIPHIDVFEANGYTKEEMKIVNETRKIMGDNSIRITCTAVRVPVRVCHCEAANIETEKKMSPGDVRGVLSKAPGVVVMDDPRKPLYPLPSEIEGRDEVFVGRIREDVSVTNGIDMWIVADNVRKGAATNAVQIAEFLID
jgi:aspartate-semialdehyde dehydrogenase